MGVVGPGHGESIGCSVTLRDSAKPLSSSLLGERTCFRRRETVLTQHDRGETVPAVQLVLLECSNTPGDCAISIQAESGVVLPLARLLARDGEIR